MKTLGQRFKEGLWAGGVGALLAHADIWFWEKPIECAAWIIGIGLLIEWGHSK